MVALIEGSTQTIRSDTPAMLTISNDTNTVTTRQGGRIVGEVTLRKQGTGNWSFGCSNLSAGDFIVAGGTVTLTASDTLPTASKESRLTILAGAKVALPEGVNAAVVELEKALTKPGRAVAVIDLNYLLRRGGVLDRLQANGAQITAPYD